MLPGEHVCKVTMLVIWTLVARLIASLCAKSLQRPACVSCKHGVLSVPWTSALCQSSLAECHTHIHLAILALALLAEYYLLANQIGMLQGLR